MSLLVARHLAKAFGGVRAVDDVSFTVDAGQMVALIGPNGAGKSTCFNLLNGQLPPDAGEVLLGGQVVTGWPANRLARAGVGRTFQIARTFGSFTVRENLQVALIAAQEQVFRPVGSAADCEPAAADRLLAALGMAALARLPAAELAYGDLKRLELALALAGRPRLLLMDEPTAGMAADERQALMQLVAGLAARDGLAVLFTEHDMAVVFGHATHILVMARGRLIAAGDPAAIRADPAVRTAYLGEADGAAAVT